jgi:CIC family chloride channel protein
MLFIGRYFMAGPSQEKKLQFVSSDQSFSTQEGFLRLGRNIIIVMILGATTWLACTILKLAVIHSSSLLFSPFHNEAHAEIHDYKLLTQEKMENIVSDVPHEIVIEHQPEKKDEHTSFYKEEAAILLFTLFFGGLIRGFLISRKSWQNTEGDGATQTISYFLESYALGNDYGVAAEHRYKYPTFKHAVKRLLMTFLTLGCGGSGGLEGPVIPVGESIASGWSKIFKIFETEDLRAFQMAGIAAAVCSLLNAPFASAIFAAEVVYSERIVYRTLLYSIFSVVVAFQLNTMFLGQGKLFVIPPHSVEYGLFEYFNVVVVAVFCSAPVGIGLNYIFKFFKTKFNYIPVIARSPLGALFAGLIAIGMWYWLGIEPNHILGMGEETIEDVLYGIGNPELKVWWVLLIIIFTKAIATGLTLMTGGSAGLLIPSMVLGGLMGAVLHSLFGFTAGIELFVVSGIASSLVSIIEIPISAVLLVISIFGESYAAPAMLSVAVCHLLVKNYKLYLKAY